MESGGRVDPLPDASASTPRAVFALGATVHPFPLPSVLTRTRSQPGPCRAFPFLPAHSQTAASTPMTSSLNAETNAADLLTTRILGDNVSNVY